MSSDNFYKNNEYFEGMNCVIYSKEIGIDIVKKARDMNLPRYEILKHIGWCLQHDHIERFLCEYF